MEREIIPEGKYRARARGGEFAVAKTGTDYVQVPFEVTEGDWAGERVAWKGFFTANDRDRAIESLRTCGCTFPGNDITDLTGIDANEVEIVVEHEEGQDGRVWPRVQWVNRGGAGVKAEQRMTAAAKTSFRDRMKGVLVASKPSGGAPASSSAADRVRSTVNETFGAKSNDDIPF